MRKLYFPALALLLFACSPNVDTRGALKDAGWQQQLIVGTSTREDVNRVLGTPSAKSSFGSETWYYISERKESYAFLKADVADQSVTRITFDDAGTVKSVDNFTKEQARDIEIASRVTPTEGHEMTFMEQLFGNLGRFNAPGSSAASNQHGSNAGGLGLPGGR